jgi:hypothetical protein
MFRPLWVFAGRIFLIITVFRGDPEKLYLHIKVGMACDLPTIFLEELCTGILVIGWRQCDLKGE